MILSPLFLTHKFVFHFDRTMRNHEAAFSADHVLSKAVGPRCNTYFFSFFLFFPKVNRQTKKRLQFSGDTSFGSVVLVAALRVNRGSLSAWDDSFCGNR